MAKTPRPTQPTACRVLLALTVDGVSYAVDDLVQFPADQIASYADDGSVDPHPDAVAYCHETLGKPLQIHPGAQANAVAKAVVADLEQPIA